MKSRRSSPSAASALPRRTVSPRPSISRRAPNSNLASSQWPKSCSIASRIRTIPKTICGVVYQGSDRRNSCQFSFACDGVADEVKSKEAWDRSKLVAQKAIAGDQTIRVIGAATNYHADYVRPQLGERNAQAHQDRPSHLLFRQLARPDAFSTIRNQPASPFAGRHSWTMRIVF